MLTKGDRLSDGDVSSEKHSTLNLSRLYGGGNRKASGRPMAADVHSPHAASPKEPKEKKSKNNDKDSKDEKEPGSPTVLRKRNSLNEEIPTRGMQFLKPGLSILDQIGEPDHKGWMRKKGDRYNSWKSRYFVLKGPHLYILKSQDKSVSEVDYLK
jgi:hypothetical protein